MARDKDLLHPALGVGTQLADLGSTAGRKEWLQSTRLVSLAAYREVLRLTLTTKGGSMAIGKTDLIKEIADEVDLPTRAVKDVFDLLAEIAHEEISGGEDFTVPGVCKIKYKYTAGQKKGERYKKGEEYTGFGGVVQTAEQDSPARKERILLVPSLSTELNRIKPKRTAESQSAFLRSKTGKAVKKRLAA